ncbi:FAD-binding oxidoreductase [Gloeocapsa sp. PCC 73106]|uniref:FAD-binding oxidoreductase n=1 Tax=Gloeocapsa sp. PCC 73106 TaxID=102232 RepID=UPI0002AC24F0|nr:FAD-binding oxidoreductase [Gloeocapsa sp. PCC 73106]ELR96265.1 FAD/FMN-dependent dehydrogenase [Gloeocapsa sp. PCC 73106]
MTNAIPWEQLEPTWRDKIQRTSNVAQTPYWIAPQDQLALSETLRSAQYPLLICGNGSKLHWGGLVKQPLELVVSTQNLNRVVAHATGDLTLTVEAGVKLADLQQILRKEGQFLPLDPAYPDTATIGGIIATADSGSWRQRYGGVRDLLLGVTFVRADGTIAKAGGRVVKNVAGYDLMKLFTGSYGTLGVISEVTLRLYPVPEASTTFILTGDSEAIAQASRSIFYSNLTPTVFDLISAFLVEKLEIGKGTGLILRCQTIAPSVLAQSEQLKNLAHELNLSYQTYQDDAEVNLWQQLAKITSNTFDSSAISCKIGILPQCAHDFLQICPDESLVTIHLGSGLGKLILNQVNSTTQVEQLRLACQQRQGFLTILGAPNIYKENMDVWGYTGNALTLMEKIKHQFDPHSLLNPGRFLGKI